MTARKRPLTHRLAAGRTVGGALFSPAAVALLYSVFSSSAAALAAYVEGLLLPHQLTGITGQSSEIIPYVGNISTIVDFALLNPAIIYFLVRSRQSRQAAQLSTGGKLKIPLYHRIGFALISVALSVAAMKFYIEGFHNTFDATLIPNNGDGGTITITGWVIFFWTALFLAVLFDSLLEHAVHVRYLLGLTAADIEYAPLHRDGCGGLRVLMNPSLYFAYAMLFLLLIFIIFIIHDNIIYNIDESNRTWGLLLYIITIIPMFFLPYFRLHHLMKLHRDEYSDSMNAAIERMLSENAAPGARPNEKLEKFLLALDSAGKYQKVIAGFPVWPLPFYKAAPQFGAIIAAAFPVAEKLASVLFAQIQNLGAS